MPAKRSNDESKKLTTISVFGNVLLSELLEIVKSYEVVPPQEKILWDFSKAKVGDSFSSDEIHETAVLVKKTMLFRTSGKTAFVASEDLEFGLIRMYIAYLEGENPAYPLEAFRTREEALQWLDDKLP